MPWPQQMHDLPHVHLPAAKLPRSPNLSTSPLSSHSVVPLYDGPWPEQPPAFARQLFLQPDGVCRLLLPCLPEAEASPCCSTPKVCQSLYKVGKMGLAVMVRASTCCLVV